MTLAGLYTLVTHMFRHGKQHKPGDVLELTHEEAAEGLQDGTIKRTGSEVQQVASAKAFERMTSTDGDSSDLKLGGGSPPEVVEAARLRREAEEKAAAEAEAKAKADAEAAAKAEADRKAAEEAEQLRLAAESQSTTAPSAGTGGEAAPETKGGKKAK